MTDSPLLTAAPDSLDALFSADPLTLSDAQLDTLVAELRRRRSLFASEEAAKAAAGKKSRAKPTIQPSATAAALDKPTVDFSLEDL